MGSAKVDVRVLCEGSEVDRALARPVRLIRQDLAGVMYGGSVYPLHIGDTIELAEKSHPKAACDTFVEEWQDIPYVEQPGPLPGVSCAASGEDLRVPTPGSGASLPAASSMRSTGLDDLSTAVSHQTHPSAYDRCVGVTSRGTRCRLTADGVDGLCLLHRTAGTRSGLWTGRDAEVPPNSDARSKTHHGNGPVMQDHSDNDPVTEDIRPNVQAKNGRESAPRRLWDQPKWIGAHRSPTEGEPTWIDAFPWLRAAEMDEWGAWWEEPLEGPESLRQARFARISDLAMQRLADWTLSQICPGLDLATHFLDLGLPLRATNAMQRHGIRVNGQLLGVTPAAMLGWRNVGVGTIDACLRILAEISTVEVGPSTLTDGLQASGRVDVEQAPAIATEMSTSVHADLSMIARWYATIGRSTQPLLGAPLPLATPATVASARARIDALLASDVLGAGELGDSIADHFADAVSLFDDRATSVLRYRVFADSPVTLEEFAQAFGVTRERVRQIEGKARAELFGIINGDGVLAEVAEAVRALVGIILPLEDLLRHLPARRERRACCATGVACAGSA